MLVAFGCLTSQQHASVSQGRIRTDNFTCCHTEIEVADPTFYLNQSQYSDTGPTSPSTDPIMPGAWQGSHWSASFEITGMTRPRKKIPAQEGFEPGIFRSQGGRLNHKTNEAVYTQYYNMYSLKLLPLTLYQYNVHQKRITMIYIKIFTTAISMAKKKKKLCLPKRLVTSLQTSMRTGLPVALKTTYLTGRDDTLPQNDISPATSSS